MSKSIRLSESNEKIIVKATPFLGNELITRKLDFVLRDYLRLKREATQALNTAPESDYHNSPETLPALAASC